MAHTDAGHYAAKHPEGMRTCGQRIVNTLKKRYRYLFGPVPSRRFGRSLGVDLTPFKTCSLNCVFCQLGRTPRTTITRQDYVPVDAVYTEIASWLKTDGKADFITLSGCGEPTLHSAFGDVLQFLKKNTAIRTALLTNGTLLHLPEVNAAASYADVVKVSMSVWNQPSFEWVNRPHPKLRFEGLFTGLTNFREQYQGDLWLEVFLCLGINALPQDVIKIAERMKAICPNRIHLNTVVRPPAEDFAVPVPAAAMEKLTRLFEPVAEVIAEFRTDRMEHIRINEETIRAMLRRRPCTIEQIAEVFGMHINEVSKYLGKLVRTNQIRTVRRKNAVYYTACAENANSTNPHG